VTGGCGFIGRNLARRLATTRTPVRLFDDLSGAGRAELGATVDFDETDPTDPPIPGRPQLVVGDVRDAAAIRDAMAEIDIVCHLAARPGVIPSVEDPRADFSRNVAGLLETLIAARDAGVERLIFASSNAPLGDAPPPLTDATLAHPVSPYGAAKLAGEGYCRAFHSSYGLATVVLRFSNVYGPYCFGKESVVALFCRRALAGEPLIIYGDGAQTRDLLHVDDVCDGVRAAAAAAPGGSLFHLGSGVEARIGDLAERVAALAARDLGRVIPIERRPARAGEVQRSVSDPGPARTALGFTTQRTLDAGLEEVWRWFRESRGNAG